MNSAIAVGRDAYASNTGSPGGELDEAKAQLERLTALLDSQSLDIDGKRKIQDDVHAVRRELDEERPNFKRARKILKRIVANLGPAESLAAIAAHVLSIVRPFV